MGSEPRCDGQRYSLIRAIALVAALSACGTPSPGLPPAPGAEGDVGFACISRLHVESQPAGPLPSRLISLLTSEGQARLLSCDRCASYPWLAASFDSQATQAFCGVASSVMALNASGGPKPLSAPYEPYRYFTQCNIFNDRGTRPARSGPDCGRGADARANSMALERPGWRARHLPPRRGTRRRAARAKECRRVLSPKTASSSARPRRQRSANVIASSSSTIRARR